MAVAGAEVNRISRSEIALICWPTIGTDSIAVANGEGLVPGCYCCEEDLGHHWGRSQGFQLKGFKIPRTLRVLHALKLCPVRFQSSVGNLWRHDGQKYLSRQLLYNLAHSPWLTVAFEMD